MAEIKLADLRQIAKQFNPSVPCTAGEYVTHQGLFYLCIQNHTGAWDASHFSSDTIGDAISGIKEDLGNKDDWLVGTANQILSDSYTEDKVPYVSRKTGGGLSVGNREADTIVGGSIVWNQLANSRAYTKTFDSETTYYYGFSAFSPHLSNGHKYFCSANVERTMSDNDTIAILFGGLATYRYIICGRRANGADDGIVQTIGTCDNFDHPGEIYISSYGGKRKFDVGDEITISNIQCIDLTQMFGSTVADYIYSLEQATEGAGVEWFRKLFPNDYYEYDTGTLKSVEGLVSHDTVGFNQCNEEWVNGVINADGSVSSASGRYTTKDYMPVFPNTEYCVRINVFGRGRGAFYDVNKSLISYYGDFPKTGEPNVFPNNGSFINVDGGVYFTFITPSNACWFKYTVPGAVYENTCINISNTAKNGTYEPYQKHSYPLDSSLTLRGVSKLDANNQLYYDGDVYNADGTVTRKYAVDNLEALDPNVRYTGETNKTISLSLSNSYDRTAKINCISTAYEVHDPVVAAAYLSNPDNYDVGIYSYKQTASGTTTTLYLVLPINDSPIGSLVYEMATPITETAEPYEPLQICSEYGTEEYVYDSEAFPVPVGHDTKYYVNLRKKIEDSVSDVQINGTSLVTDGVANVPIATSTVMGVANIPTSGGLYISSTGALSTNRALENEIKAGTSDYKPIVPKRQHASIFFGLAKAAGDTTQSASSNAVGTYTDDALKAIRKMLGIPNTKWELIADVTVAEDSAQVNIDVDTNGEPFKLTKMLVRVNLEPATTGTNDYVSASNLVTTDTDVNSVVSAPTQRYLSNGAKSFFEYTSELFGSINYSTGSTSSNAGSSGTVNKLSGTPTNIKYYRGFRVAQYNATSSLIPQGTNIKLYGIRYDD